MTFAEFQRAAARTHHAPFPERERPLVMGLALCGEAGEVAEIIKKAAWHGKPAELAKIAEELGDLLWYIADLATYYQLCLEDVAAGNIEKLARRYPDGFVLGGGIR